MPRLVADPVGAELAGQVATAHSPRVLSEVLVPSHGAVSFQRISEVLPYQLESYTRPEGCLRTTRGDELAHGSDVGQLGVLVAIAEVLIEGGQGRVAAGPRGGRQRIAHSAVHGGRCGHGGDPRGSHPSRALGPLRAGPAAG